MTIRTLRSLENSSPEIVSRALQSLTSREFEVLDLMTAGKSNKMIGRDLQISSRTVEAHRVHILYKLQAKNSLDMVRKVTEASIYLSAGMAQAS